MIGTTIGSPTHMMVELELTELGPSGFVPERMILPVGGMIAWHDKSGVLLATVKVTSIFQGKYESSNSSEQSVSNPERLPDSSEVSSDEAADIQV